MSRLIARALPTLFNDEIEGQSCDSFAEMNDYTDLSSDASQRHNSIIASDDSSYYTDHYIQNINYGTVFICHVLLNQFVCILFD